jgi:hypothetical protein
MSWKEVFTYVVPLLLIVLLFFYWVFPLETINFGSTASRNFNFTFNNENKSMQFYPNLRYEGPNISYKISSCNLQKEDEMKRAFSTIENLTVLNFYSVESNEEISVTCDDKARFEGDLFIAGEGGPIKITKSENFNVIHEGGILLIRESKCENPNVGIHELLHALGFDHSENPNNVLYPVSKCSQEIGQDTISMINWLYSFPSLPDLMFENASAKMSGRYLDLNLTVRNGGLKDSPGAKIEVYADGKLVQEIKFDKLDVGNGRKITIGNIFILQKSINELRFLIKADFEELEKENNEVILNYNN